MKVILINPKHGGSRAIELGRWSRAVLSLCCLGLPLGMAAIGYLAGLESDQGPSRAISFGDAADGVGTHLDEMDSLREEAERTLQALSLNLAELQARMVRLDALGEHLTVIADLEEGEFDFSRPPSVGGPLAPEFNVDFSAKGLTSEVINFEAQLDDREQQLELLESVLASRKIEDQIGLSGRPVEEGWISSYFGKRIDPFSGRLTMHRGIDFAGQAGSNVVAVAAGVVTWVGDRSAYGKMVEISHDDGYISRYAHNKQNLVVVGDLVRKGDAIALMGSSGRSTGVHVHFEVFRHGRVVDPSSYVKRTER